MYDYEKYTQVKADVEESRLRAEAEADARRERLHELSPEIREIDAELSKTGPLLFKAAIDGTNLEPIRKRNEALNAKRLELIKALGLPEDYTEPKYSCPECRDTGYVNKGKTICQCLKERLVKATIISSGIGNLIEKQSFENFELGHFPPDSNDYKQMKANFEAVKAYAENFGKKRGNLLFIGCTGTGKTHLSTAVAREIIKKGYDVIYDTTQNIMSDFEEEKFKNGYQRTERRSDKYLECDLLIMDDLGTEFITAFTVSCLYNLINTRQNRGLATIISTNLTAKELSEKYEGRIASRLLGSDYRLLEFVGKDRRIYR